MPSNCGTFPQSVIWFIPNLVVVSWRLTDQLIHLPGKEGFILREPSRHDHSDLFSICPIHAKYSIPGRGHAQVEITRLLGNGASLAKTCRKTDPRTTPPRPSGSSNSNGKSACVKSIYLAITLVYQRRSARPLNNLQAVNQPVVRLTTQFGSPTMCPAPMRLTHFHIFPQFGRRPIHPQTAPTRRRGAGHDSRFLFGFEPNSIAEPNINGLGLGGWDSIRGIRAKFSRNSASFPDSLATVTICGCSFWPTSCWRRRIGLLHSDWTDLRPFLRSQQGLLDGVLCVSNALVELVAECLPAMANGNRYGSSPTRSTASPRCPRGALAKRPVVIGWVVKVGRTKRVERLPAPVRGV